MAAAALEELLVALLPALDPEVVGVDVAPALELEEELATVAFGGSRWPHAVCSVDLQAA